MAIQRFDVAQNLAYIGELNLRQQLATHQKGQGAPGIQHAAAGAAVDVLGLGDAGQDL